MVRKEKPTVLLIFVSIFSFVSMQLAGQMVQAQIDSMKQLLVKAKPDTNKVLLLMNLGNEVGYTDLKGALVYTLEGYALSSQLGYERGVGRLAYLAGILYMDVGNYQLTDSFLVIAEQKFRQLNDKKNIAKLFNARGSQHVMLGNYWVAADAYTKAAEAFDELKDTANSIIAYQNLIAVLGQVKNHERAIVLGRKTLRLAEQQRDTLSVGYSLQNLVTDLIYTGRMDEATSYLDRLLNFGNTNSDQNLSAEIYSTFGLYYFHKNDFAKAAGYFETAIQKRSR